MSSSATALDRQVQALGGENHPRARPVETQVLGEHHLIVIAEVRCRAAQLDGQDRNPPPRQPAGDAVNDHPVGEIGEGAARVLVVFEQDDFRQALLTNQLCGQVFEHQRQKAQTRGQTGGQARLDHGAATEKLQAAGLELARVHAKKLVVPTPRQQTPQTRISGGRDAGIGGLQQRRIDADLVQHLIGGRVRGRNFATALHAPVEWRWCLFPTLAEASLVLV